MSKEEKNQRFDDYSVIRVPQDAKKPMWQVTVVRLGAFACVSQLILGANLGYGMTFTNVVYAVLLGSVILQVIGAAVGAIAAKEGLSISMIAQWAGFGKIGSAIIGLIIGVCLVGWFGVQNTVFAEGMLQGTGILNIQIWSLITGFTITLIVVYGFKMLSYTANIALPLFLIVVAYATVKMLENHDIAQLATSQPAGPEIPLAVGTTMVAGGFITGAVITPDVARFLKNSKQVFIMVLISTFLGELGMCLIAALMAHALGTADIMTIMYSLSGLLGIAIVVFSTIKINDFNLYSSSLGLTKLVHTVSSKKMSRAVATIILGVAGTLLSTFGFMNYFVNFLVFMGIAIPPIAGIIVVDYFILKRDRAALDESRKNDSLPKRCEKANPITFVVWIVAFVIGYAVPIGIASINSIVAAALLYYILMIIVAKVQKKPHAEFTQTEDI